MAIPNPLSPKYKDTTNMKINGCIFVPSSPPGAALHAFRALSLKRIGRVYKNLTPPGPPDLSLFMKGFIVYQGKFSFFKKEGIKVLYQRYLNLIDKKNQ